ncbi:MAG: hypothetical protein ACI8W8_003270 [Rhodothermales bacterium]
MSINSPQGAFGELSFGADAPDAPTITAFEVADADSSDDVFAAGDTLTIRFGEPTDGAGTGLAKAAVDALFTFTPDIGSDYTGSWIDNQTFVVTMGDGASAAIKRGDATVTPAGDAADQTAIRLDESPDGAASSAQSPALSGYFGGSAINWGTATNITVTGASLSKAGSSDWNGVVSSDLPALYAPGDAYVEFTASETNSNRMIGFANLATSGQFWGSTRPYFSMR